MPGFYPTFHHFLTRSRIWGAVVLVAIVALFAGFISVYYVPAFGGVDENGYFTTAKGYVTKGDASKRTSDPYEFVSANCVEVRENVYYAKYPIGYPALGALAWKLGGRDAIYLVNPALAALAVAGIFLLGREFFGAWGGALAAILLASNPLHCFFALSALSHTSATCFAIWGMLFMWRWTERGGWWNAALGGALTAFTYTTRYSEALLALPACALMVWRGVDLWRGTPSGQRRQTALRFAGQVALMAAAAAITVTPLLIHHGIAYGSPWVNGYTLCKEDTGFSWEWFGKNWRLTLTRMNEGGLFLVFPLGLAGMAYLLVHRLKRGLLIALWTLPSLLLYTAYYWAPEGDGWGFVRFFASIFPPLILAALSLLCTAVPSRPWWNAALGAVVLLVAGANLDEAARDLEPSAEHLRLNRSIMDAVVDKLPPDAVILSDDQVLNFIDFVGDFHLYSFDIFSRNGLMNRLNVLNDEDPHPFQREKAEKLKRLFGNKNDGQLAEIQRKMISDFLVEGRTVALIGRKDAMGRWRARLSDRFEFVDEAEFVELPPPRKEVVRRGKARAVWPVIWSLVRVKPRPEGKADDLDGDPVAIQEKIDRLQFQIENLRTENRERYPALEQSEQRIAEMERELRELRGRLRMDTRRRPPSRRGARPPLPPSSMSAPAAIKAALSAGAVTAGSAPSSAEMRIPGNAAAVVATHAPVSVPANFTLPSATTNALAAPAMTNAAPFPTNVLLMATNAMRSISAPPALTNAPPQPVPPAP